MNRTETFESTPLLPAARMVPPPRAARLVALSLGSGMVCFVVFAALAPWQQSIGGTGRVIAYAPLERQQMIDAPLDGRVVRWFVREGATVQAGDPLVELADNDPDLLSRLENERAITEARLMSYRERRGSMEARMASIRAAQTSATTAARARVRVSEDRLAATEHAIVGAEAEWDASVANLERSRNLVVNGLVSQRDVDLAVAAEARARTSRDAARAGRNAAQSERDAAEAQLLQAIATGLAETENANASLQSAETDAQAAEAALLRIDSRLARQNSQRITAPRDGTVLRLVVAQGGEQVKIGDPLLVLVPTTENAAVELWIDGNDAALVTASQQRKVRLQFEGWPALQFSGWPSVAVGTFGGVVQYVDATDDGNGNFRIVVVPDPDERCDSHLPAHATGNNCWPSPQYLRQGARANGWILLDTVRVGFELWRQFNGFPPAVQLPTTSPHTSSGDRHGVSSGRRGLGVGSSYGQKTSTKQAYESTGEYE